MSFGRKNSENHTSAASNPLHDILKDMKRNFVHFMTKLGAHITHIAAFTARRAARKIGSTTLHFGRQVKALFRASAQRIKDRKSNRISFIDRTKADFRNFGEEFRTAHSDKGAFGALGVVLRHAAHVIFGEGGVLVTAFNYTAPIVSIAFLIALVDYVGDIEYGVTVYCNGQQLGVISEEVILTEAQNIIQDKITYLDGNDTVTVDSRLSLKMVDGSETVIDSEELAEAMLQNTDRELIEAVGVYLNGELLGVVEDSSAIETALDDLLEKYDCEGEGEVYFKDDISYVPGTYIASSVEDDSEIIDLFTSMKTTEKYYTIVAGDAPIKIAKKCGITLDELVALNPDILTTCYVDQQVLLNREEPYLTVCTTKKVEYTEVVDYDTVEVDNPKQYKGINEVTVKGVEGEAEVVAEITYENGYEVEREILSRVVTKEPVTQEISVGTMSAKTANKAVSYHDGIFCWPVNGGYISSYFGDGRGHKGIDIAASAGTVIFAAEAGRVETASYGWNGGYGNWVVIDHGNGYKTYYAHQSKLLVSPGQYVERGDPIGQVGNTGNSFGNHCHFEVRYYGSYMNPMDYLN